MQHPSAQQGRGEVIRPLNAVCTSRRRAGIWVCSRLPLAGPIGAARPDMRCTRAKVWSGVLADRRATMCTPVHCLMPPLPFQFRSTGACSAAAPPPLYLVEQAVRNRRGADVSFASVPMNDIAALALQRHRTYFSQCEATRGAFYLQEDNLWWSHRYLMDGQGSGGARLKRVKVISGGGRGEATTRNAT